MLEEVLGFFSVGWVWLHILLIFIFRKVVIYEDIRWIITLELFLGTVVFVFWIVRIVKMLR